MFACLEVVSTVPRRFSARCRFLVVVPTWRRLRVLLRVVVPLPTPCGVNYSSSTDFCHPWPDQKVVFLTLAGYIERGKSNY